MARIDAFFELMHKHQASDLHMVSGQQPALRIHGDLERIKFKKLDDDDLRAMLYEITPEEKIKEFEETGDVDFAYEIPGLGRYRANLFMQNRGIGAIFREIPSEIKTIDQLGLPKVLKRLALLPRGLVLVTGPTGSGKSTTLAAIIDEANRHRKDHIITIEDPIEFVHESKNCIINHREVGTHTRSFATALRAALREDPDIILVGEMRDLETMRLAIEAAATGHLVFSTLHTEYASKTINRIIEVFPTDEQEQIRQMLADALRAVVSQTLLKRSDRPGRIAALEILVATHGVRAMIREKKTQHLLSAIQTGRKYGMQTLDDSIMEHLQAGRISAQEAYMKCANKEMFRPFLSEPPVDFTEV